MDALYKILGVPQDASAAQIRQAYKRLAQKHHPDRNGGDNSAFEPIRKAYKILSDPRTRAAYDRDGTVEDGVSITEEAKGHLRQYFLQVVANTRDVEHMDIVARVHELLHKDEATIRGNQDNASKAEANLLQVRARLGLSEPDRSDSADPFLFSLLDARLADVGNSMRQFNRTLEMVQEARRLLNHYTYRTETQTDSSSTTSLYRHRLDTYI